MKQLKISVVIIARDEEKMIEDCLASVKWADEVILIDTGSTDKTLEIARHHKVEIVKIPPGKLAYAQWRNRGIKEAKGEWVLYLDADERVTPQLREEIKKVIRNPGQKVAFFIPRRNFLLGKELHWGGWWPDYVKRLFLKNRLKKWVGELHEEPVFEGEWGKLKNSIVHFQPESIEPMLKKTIRWSVIEAKLLYKANHPRITWWRVLRMGLTTLFNRLIKKQGFRDGTEGWIESIYQAFHTMIVYVHLWEIQNEKSRSF